MMPLVLLVILAFVAAVALSMVRVSEQISGPRQLPDRAARHQLCGFDEDGNLHFTDPDGRHPEKPLVETVSPASASKDSKKREARPVVLLKDRWPVPSVRPKASRPSPTILEA